MRQSPVQAMPANVLSAPIVVSGFGSYGGRVRNASLCMGRSMVTGQSDTAFVEMPVVWGMPGTWVARRTLPPRAWIALGEAEGALRLEAVACNRRSAHPDTLGNLPPAMDIMPGPRHMLCTAPLPRITAALISAGFPASISDNAGGYLCNELFYHLITRNTTAWQHQTLVLFVHIPPFGTATSQADRPVIDTSYLASLGETLLTTVRQCLS